MTLNTPDLEAIYHAYTPIVHTASLLTNFHPFQMYDGRHI